MAPAASLAEPATVNPHKMDPRDLNDSYFRFLRARQAFVLGEAERETIEGFIVWGAAADALSRIHGGRVGVSSKPNRRCFVRGMLDLTPGRGLERPAVPLIHHDLRLELPAAADHSVFTTYRAASGVSRIWNPEDDARLASQMPELLSKFPDAQRVVQRNSYAEILYEEYRCCAVHGLELGRKTCQPLDARIEPHYMNYMYGDTDSRAAKHRYQTRIVFPLAYLAGLLTQMIEAEEEACVSAGWIIPAYPTLSD